MEKLKRGAEGREWGAVEKPGSGKRETDTLRGTMRDDILEAWRTNNKINLYLIDEISKEGMLSTLSTRGGRTVAGQFGHVHTNRVWQLEKRAKDLAEGLVKFPPKIPPSKAELKKAFAASGKAVEKYLVGVLEGTPKRKGFRKGIFSTFGYLIAHESHHRGAILLTIKQCGHNVGKDAQYGIWGMWDKV